MHYLKAYASYCKSTQLAIMTDFKPKNNLPYKLMLHIQTYVTFASNFQVQPQEGTGW